MNRRYPEVAARAEHRCEYCRAPEVLFNFPFEVEHIIPPMHGGSDDLDNLALACRSCNVRKGSHIRQYDPVSGREERLYDPRRHRWQEHFRPDHVTGRIEGVTAIGRATIARLDVNGSAQLDARRYWLQLGLFP